MLSKEKKQKKAYIYYENNNNLNINDDYKSEISAESFHNEIDNNIIVHITELTDSLKYFLIPIMAQKVLRDKIISININDKVKNSLSDLFTEKYLIYPKFLFYWDSQLLCATITGGVDKIITFADLKPRASWSYPNQ